jgi:tRNA(Arg) A34 adenosine deaminase TadA
MSETTDAAWMRRAIALAELAKSHGNHPFGALLVTPDLTQVLLESENSVITDHDCTAHAELALVRKASQQLSDAQRASAVLVTSTEPCPMCSGAIYWSGIRAVVYGCSTQRLHAIAGPGLVLPCRDVFAHGAEPVVVRGPVLEDEAAAVHIGFWNHTSH